MSRKAKKKYTKEAIGVKNILKEEERVAVR